MKFYLLSFKYNKILYEKEFKIRTPFVVYNIK